MSYGWLSWSRLSAQFEKLLKLGFFIYRKIGFCLWLVILIIWTFFFVLDRLGVGLTANSSVTFVKGIYLCTIMIRPSHPTKVFLCLKVAYP